MSHYQSKEVRFSNVVSWAVGLAAIYMVGSAVLTYGYSLLPPEQQHQIESFFGLDTERSSSGLEKVTSQ